MSSITWCLFLWEGSKRRYSSTVTSLLWAGLPKPSKGESFASIGERYSRSFRLTGLLTRT